MISPHTPPGTKVVFYKPACAVNSISMPADYEGVRVGDVLTITSIGVDLWFERSGGFYAEVAEFPMEQIGLNLLRRLDLPECLTSLLNTQLTDMEVA